MATKINNTYFFRKAGGGGGASEAVKYTEQTLTEAQQMQARKNLDLYNTMREVVTDDFAGDLMTYMEVDPSTGIPYYGWVGEYYPYSSADGFVEAGMNIPYGYTLESENGGITINGKTPTITSGENWQMMVDPDNQSSILIKTTADNVSVSTRLGTFLFPHKGFYTSANLYTWNDGGEEEPYFQCSFTNFVSSFTENLTVSHDAVTQVPYKYIPTQSVGSSADDQHFPTARNVYDYVRNNAASGCVKYDTSQNLSSTNQMRARRNQGLYYKETESVSRTYAWETYDGNPASGYGSVTVGDFIYVNLTGGGFPGSSFASFGLMFDVDDVVVGTDVVRRNIHNASGSMGYFYANDAESPALVIEAYSGCQYEGQSFSSGVWVLAYDENDNYSPVDVLYINGKPYTAYNKVGADLIESLNINLNYNNNDGWTSNLTYNQIHKALKKNMPVLASMTKSGLTQYTENITDLCDSANDGPVGKLCIVFESGVDNWDSPQYYKKTIVLISEEDGVDVKEVKLALYT